MSKGKYLYSRVDTLYQKRLVYTLKSHLLITATDDVDLVMREDPVSWAMCFDDVSCNDWEPDIRGHVQLKRSKNVKDS